jgi:hypothetical protein
MNELTPPTSTQSFQPQLQRLDTTNLLHYSRSSFLASSCYCTKPSDHLHIRPITPLPNPPHTLLIHANISNTFPLNTADKHSTSTSITKTSVSVKYSQVYNDRVNAPSPSENRLNASRKLSAYQKLQNESHHTPTHSKSTRLPVLKTPHTP